MDKLEITLTEEELNKLSYIQIVVQSLISGRTYSGFIYPKIEKGSVATPYSPYGQGCISEIVANKNLHYKISEVNKRLSTTQGNTYSVDGYSVSSFIEVKANSKYALTTSISSYCVEYDKDFKFLKGYGKTSSGIITISENAKYFKFDFKSDDTKVQFEEGEVATDYISHAEQLITIPTQQPMRAVGDVRDCFIKKDGKRYERHLIYRIIFDGTEPWMIESNGRFGITQKNLPKVPKAPDNNNICMGNMCNYYKESTPSLTWAKTQGFCIDMASCLRIYDNTYSSSSDLDGFKSKLAELYNAGTPLYVDYILETPVDLECTKEQNSILDELEKAQSYKNVTHIYSTNEVSPVANVTYYTETDEKIQNNGNIGSRPILRLEKTTSDDVEMMINNIRFKYHFNNEEYVEIDCEEKETKYDDLNRSRQIEIGYEFPKLNVGENDIVMYEGDCIIKVLRKDRWR